MNFQVSRHATEFNPAAGGGPDPEWKEDRQVSGGGIWPGRPTPRKPSTVFIQLVWKIASVVSTFQRYAASPDNGYYTCRIRRPGTFNSVNCAHNTYAAACGFPIHFRGRRGLNSGWTDPRLTN